MQSERAKEYKLWIETLEGKRNMMSDARVKIVADHDAEIERRARLDEAKWWYQHAGLGMCYRPCTGKELAGCPYCQRIAALAESQPAPAKEDK